jgi:ribonuclease P protein component
MFALHSPDENPQIVKAEFTVAKRIMKKAVHRNRAKRQMRAAFRNIMQSIAFKETVHLIFFYNDKTELPFADIQASMQNAIEQFCKTLTNTLIDNSTDGLTKS